MNMNRLWLKVYSEGREVESNGDMESGWSYYKRELEVDGKTYEAAIYHTEIRTARDLQVFNPETESWEELWWDDSHL